MRVRSSLVSVAGALLVGSTLVGWVVLAVTDPGDWRDGVVLGEGGALAVLLYWASSARTWPRVAGRAVAGAVLVFVLSWVTYWISFSSHGFHVTIFGHLLPDPFQEGSGGDFVTMLGKPESDGGFQGDPILGFSGLVPVRVTSFDLIALVLAVLCSGVGHLALTTASGARRLVFLALATSQLWFYAIDSFADDFLVSGTVAVLGVPWLVWALRTRARQANGGGATRRRGPSARPRTRP